MLNTLVTWILYLSIAPLNGQINAVKLLSLQSGQTTVGQSVEENAIPPNPGSCRYGCVDGTWQLVGSNPSPGFTCPESIDGGCDTGGDQILVPAMPEIEISPSIEDDSSRKQVTNSGIYSFRPSRGDFAISSAKAVDGRYFQPTLTIDQLVELYPDDAPEIMVKINSMGSKTFKVDLPALTR